MDEKTKQSGRLIRIGGVTEKKAGSVIQKMLELDAEDPEKDILLVISSYGGETYEFLGIYDTIRLLRCDVATLGIGKSLSCGFFLLLSGTKGKRFVTPNTVLMTHEMGVGAEGRLTEAKAEMAQSQREQKLINEIVLKHTRIKKDALKKFIGKDVYLTPRQAIRYGIVDHIVSSSAIWNRLQL